MNAKPPSRPAPGIQLTQRAMLIWGAIVAMALLSFYVHVLQESVIRGDRLRADMSGKRAPATAWDARAYAASNESGQGSQVVPAMLRQVSVHTLGNIRP